MHKTIPYSTMAGFLAGHRAAAPAAVAALDTEAGTALLSEICATLQPSRNDAGLVVPYETHVTLASA